MESAAEPSAAWSATPARVLEVSSTRFRTPAPLLFGSAPAPQEFKPTHSGAASGFKVPASRLREGFWRLRNARRAGRDRAAAGSACGRGGCARPCGQVTMRPGSGRMPGVCACSRSALRVGPEPGIGAAAGQARGLAPTEMGIAWGHGLALASVCPMSRRPRTRRFPAMPPQGQAPCLPRLRLPRPPCPPRTAILCLPGIRRWCQSGATTGGCPYGVAGGGSGRFSPRARSSTLSNSGNTTARPSNRHCASSSSPRRRS